MLCSQSIQAEAKLKWRALQDGSIKLQVQGWHQEAAPKLSLAALAEEGGDLALPALNEMSVKGNWELSGWKPQLANGKDLAEGLYSFSINGEKFELGEFKFNQQYCLLYTSPSPRDS